ncbi:hypothetical protein ACS85_01665 [Vibrio parahaemolyticus]|nr:hypothetical protein ACS85_01665 [Vibrio parahaemolyticus]
MVEKVDGGLSKGIYKGDKKMSSGANGVPIATLKTIRYKKGVVSTNLLRLSKFGGPPRLNFNL